MLVVKVHENISAYVHYKYVLNECGLSTTFKALNEFFLHLLLSKLFIVSDNTCTKVTCKILFSHKAHIQ